MSDTELFNVLINLMSGVRDPKERMAFAKTLRIIETMYLHGQMDDAELLKSLRELVYTVLWRSRPELFDFPPVPNALPQPSEEAKRIAEKTIQKLYGILKSRAIYMRARGRFRRFIFGGRV